MPRHPRDRHQDRTSPPAADPRSGRNPGYAETMPRDRQDVRPPSPAPEPSSPDVDYDVDAAPDPAADR